MYFAIAQDNDYSHRGYATIRAINAILREDGRADEVMDEPLAQFTDPNTGNWIESYPAFTFVSDDDGSDLIPLTPDAALLLQRAAARTVVDPKDWRSAPKPGGAEVALSTVRAGQQFIWVDDGEPIRCIKVLNHDTRRVVSLEDGFLFSLPVTEMVRVLP